MGANTTIYVKVVREVVAWVEVSAVTLASAMELARAEDEVVRVVEAQYAAPYTERSD